MITYRSRWSERYMFSEKEKNKLYEIVCLYGAYLYYIDEINEQAFTAFFNATKEKGAYCYINAANRKAKKYFHNILISSTKMKKLIATSNHKIAKSYDWMPEYVNFILNECMCIEELKQYIINYIFKDCDNCKDTNDISVYEENCEMELLGFQYLLLDNIAISNQKKSVGAMECINKVRDNDNLKIIIQNCSYAN